MLVCLLISEVKMAKDYKTTFIKLLVRSQDFIVFFYMFKLYCGKVLFFFFSLDNFVTVIFSKSYLLLAQAYSYIKL